MTLLNKFTAQSLEFIQTFFYSEYSSIRRQEMEKQDLPKIVTSQQHQNTLIKQNKYLLALFEQRISKIPTQFICRIQHKQTNQKYIGQFKLLNHKRLKHGLGKITSQKYLYIGEWLDDNKQGNGIEIDAEGNRYEGQYKNNQRHGFGIQKLVNGDRYVGEWRQNQKHGEGTQFSGLNKETYEGKFQAGLRFGKGKLLFRSGDLFQGNWIKDKKQGKGIIIFYNGDVFKGNWKNNVIMGTCSLNFKNGDYFIGNYLQGKRKGFGTYIFASGDKIQGQWDGDDVCVGKLFYVNSEVYEGKIYKGQRDGWGKYHYQNGDIYEGYWRKDEKSGFGQYFSGNKKSFSGIWSHNRELHGQYQIQNSQHEDQSGPSLEETIKERSRKKIFEQTSNLDEFATPKAVKNREKYFF